MTPHEIIAAFADAVHLLEAVEGKLRRRTRPPKTDPDQLDLLKEAIVRTRQIRYLLARFADLEHEYQWRGRQLKEMAQLDPQGHDERAVALSVYPPVLELHGEAFYFFAWRLREVLRGVAGFTRFDPVGVREVRNWLLEHPEKKNIGVMARSYTLDCEEGLILKPFGGHPATRAVDRGLYPNAAAFITELMPLVQAALQRAMA